MSKSTYKGFIEFINSQPKDTEVNHCMWHTCAVGDYLEHCGEGRKSKGLKSIYSKAPPLWSKDYDENQIFHILNVSSAYSMFGDSMFIGDKMPDVGTYGKLQEWLKKNPQDKYYEDSL